MSGEGGARFSLPVGEGSGAILGMAAGDTASGVCQGAYSAVTQQAVVVAYHLFRHGVVDRPRLAEELVEMDGDDVDPSVYRDLSPDLSKWIESYKAGEPEPAVGPSLDPAVRAVPLGVWCRRRPDHLIEAVLATVRVTHLDAASAVLAAAVAGAVAGGCFAQNGRDLLMAVAEVAQGTARSIQSDEVGYVNPEGAAEAADRIGLLSTMVGASREELTHAVGDDTIGRCCAALALAAPVSETPVAVVESAVSVGGSHTAAIVGAVIGSRIGLRRWPWSFPNDTWFAAIGQRLVEGITDLSELPIPYAVEQRVSFSTPYPPL